MKFEIEPPVERMVTLRMTLKEATALATIAPNVTVSSVVFMGGSEIFAKEVVAVMQKIAQSYFEFKGDELQ